MSCIPLRERILIEFQIYSYDAYSDIKCDKFESYVQNFATYLVGRILPR